MTTTDSIQTYHDQSRQFFEKTAAEKARETGFVKNHSPLNGSDLQLDHTSATQAERVQCEFYAKLIALLVFSRMTGVAEHLLGEKISPVQLFRRLRGNVEHWLRLLGRGRARTARDWLRLLGRYIKPSLRQAQSTQLRLEALSVKTAQQRTLHDPLGFLRERHKNAAARCAAFTQRLVIEPLCFEVKAAVFQRAKTTSMP